MSGDIVCQLANPDWYRRNDMLGMMLYMWTVETWEQSILCIGRYYGGEKLLGLFNFSEYDKTAWINETDGIYLDLLSGRTMRASGVNIPAYGFYYLKKI